VEIITHKSFSFLIISCLLLNNCLAQDRFFSEKPETRPYPAELGNAYNDYRVKEENKVKNAILNSFRSFNLSYVTLTASTPIEGFPSWRYSSWLGNFYQSSSIWMYHDYFGWVFPERCGEGFWLWSKTLEWFWTGPKLFPCIYSKNKGGWLYSYGPSKGGITLYQYSNSSTFTIPISN
jgi:hypothetical protein